LDTEGIPLKEFFTSDIPNLISFLLMLDFLEVENIKINKPASIKADLHTTLMKTNPVYQFIQSNIKLHPGAFIPCMKKQGRHTLDALNLTTKISDLNVFFIKLYEAKCLYKGLSLIYHIYDICPLLASASCKIYNLANPSL
jgi:hypothetical protein